MRQVSLQFSPRMVPFLLQRRNESIRSDFKATFKEIPGCLFSSPNQLRLLNAHFPFNEGRFQKLALSYFDSALCFNSRIFAYMVIFSYLCGINGEFSLQRLQTSSSLLHATGYYPFLNALNLSHYKELILAHPPHFLTSLVHAFGCSLTNRFSRVFCIPITRKK